ncbi:lipoprotein [Candidatus Kinetoplastibacterium blastocrithidii TCC012E]|uniref:Lipoprotein n=1 Tax=Candidatus Kinetoplastidibacterium blastocrithidiae TCC012E TaxID=1208922 RepID=M1LVA6_9PROT|nr:VacJ family lipoprotein [Candidatus Kinetoplastibacterium blastocrithidii]AFZ83384.1 lipoprotein [Candidatus Kinetoplastibacterium blastocrithidii (ex Strigomonas culicis)]AGF49482.1 lipoprotein [Candidatus Kinetoplastibacterium blastocrithidii TCC012E]
MFIQNKNSTNSINVFALIIIFSCFILSACSAFSHNQKNEFKADYAEKTNRVFFKINQDIDNSVLIPLANCYRLIIPETIRDCIHNALDNADSITSALNSILQGNCHDAINTLGRFMFNTTMGIGGCFDVASKTGAMRIPNDFGTTLAIWGIKPGPYIVLPLIGPSNLRDSIGSFCDLLSSPVKIIPCSRYCKIGFASLVILDARMNLLYATDLLNTIAIDPYTLTRDSYMGKRAIANQDKDDTRVPDYED